MTIQKMDIKSYELLLLNDFELKSCNGGGWLKYAWKAFQALEIADGINEAVNAIKDGFSDGYNGHGASGTW